MIQDPRGIQTPRQIDSDDLFGKLDSLIEQQRTRGARRDADGAPLLTDPVEVAAPAADLPVLDQVIDPRASAERLSQVLAEKRRQLQVALYLRLRQRLDQELDAALADDHRLGAVALHPAFVRAAEELRAALPIAVRESVEQVFGLESLEALLGQASRGDIPER